MIMSQPKLLYETRPLVAQAVALNENHLRAVLTDYIDNYYNVARTHMSLNKDSPVHRAAQSEGKIVSQSVLGGLHHIDRRVA